MERTDFLLRLATAFLLGGLIGLERQYRNQMAGIKTNVLVSLGACLFIMFSNLGSGSENARLAAQVISGIGFLGGGVIIREGFNIRGLSTAATLWCTAAIGVLASQGYIFEAIVGTFLILVANIALRPLSRRMYQNQNKAHGAEMLYKINVKCYAKDEFLIRSLLIDIVKERKIILRNLESQVVEATDRVNITASITSLGRTDAYLEKIVGRIGLEEGVVSVGWEVVDILDH